MIAGGTPPTPPWSRTGPPGLPILGGWFEGRVVGWTPPGPPRQGRAPAPPGRRTGWGTAPSSPAGALPCTPGEDSPVRGASLRVGDRRRLRGRGGGRRPG